jgi:hypothetical protein
VIAAVEPPSSSFSGELRGRYNPGRRLRSDPTAQISDPREGVSVNQISPRHADFFYLFPNYVLIVRLRMKLTKFITLVS